MGMFALWIFLVFIYPTITFAMRNQDYDHLSIFDTNQTLASRLYFSTTKSYTKGTVVWSNRSLNYLPTSNLVDCNFTFSIPEEIAKNQSAGYLTLVINPVDNNRNIFLRAQTQLINWKRVKTNASRILIGPKSGHQKPTYEWKPKVYRKYRFTFVYMDIINQELIIPYGFQMSNNRIIPPFEYNEFYNIPSEERIINITQGHNATLGLELSFIKYSKWQLYFTFDQSFKIIKTISEEWSNMMMHEINLIKKIVLETKPLLLWITGICSVLHYIFHILAFEYDVKFWIKRKNFRGISMSTIVNSFLSDIIILLYTLDSDTPALLRLMNFVSCVLNLWKLGKFIEIKFKWPILHIREDYKSEEIEADKTGLKYCYIIVTPIIFGICIYQAFTQEFKGVRSFIIHSLAALIYSYGFLGMIPQLYVNYKLKTVAGMSKTAFAYKFLNTFIDDLHTFVANMPLMMKIACFRDDIIFFIWLYQCMIYKTDSTRVNEFNMQEKPDEEEETNEKLAENKKDTDNDEKANIEGTTDTNNEGKIE